MTHLEKEYVIRVSPENFYQGITDQASVAQWSGAPAVMSDVVGAPFSLWGGSITGINSKVSTTKLEQLWKESSWQEYSVVSFEWGDSPNGLVVRLSHSGFPTGSFENIKRGWDKHYMNPLISWLERNKF